MTPSSVYARAAGAAGLLLLGLVLLRPEAQAQTLTSALQYEFNYARPNSPTMRVYVWGETPMTGIWNVDQDVTFIQFMSILKVGGVIGDVRSLEDRPVTISLLRPGTGEPELIYQDLAQNVLFSDPATLPQIREGDIVYLEAEQRRRVTWRGVIGVVGSLASFTLLMLRLYERVL